jgi:cephalosporin hydroxylase
MSKRRLVGDDMELWRNITFAGKMIQRMGVIARQQGLKNLVLIVLTEKLGLGYLTSNGAASRLKEINPNSVDGVLAAADNFNYYGLEIIPAQIKSEIRELLGMLEKNRPKTVIEIGIFRGGTLFLFTKMAAPDATIIGIDFGIKKWRRPIYHSFTSGKQKMHILELDSHKNSTVDAIKRILKGKKVDLLFIDGDHSYEGAKRDFELYKGLVGHGGIIAIHDIASDSEGDHCYVKKLWDEVKNDYEYKEIIANRKQNLFGIGILKI